MPVNLDNHPPHRAPLDYADDGIPFGDYGDDEPAATGGVADQITGAVIVLVVVLALIGGATVIADIAG